MNLYLHCLGQMRILFVGSVREGRGFSGRNSASRIRSFRVVLNCIFLLTTVTMISLIPKPDYNLTTTWQQQPEFNLTTNWLQSDYKLSSTWLQPDYNLTITWLQPDYNLTTTRIQPDYNLCVVFILTTHQHLQRLLFQLIIYKEKYSFR